VGALLSLSIVIYLFPVEWKYGYSAYILANIYVVITIVAIEMELDVKANRAKLVEHINLKYALIITFILAFGLRMIWRLI